MSVHLYGPDGGPLVVRRDNGQLARVVDRKAYEASVAKARRDDDVDTVIAKHVRSQAVSIGATWDKARGKPKPTPVDNGTLRAMAMHNEWVRAILIKRKQQVGGQTWSIKVKDTDDPSGAAHKAARAVTKLLQNPSMYGSEPNSRDWQSFIGMWIEDYLVLDRACVEKERDGRKWIIAMYPVDGATIRPNLNDRGGYLDDAYVQLVDGQITARFGMEELIVSMAHEQTDIRYAGYGLSPLESLVVSVTADLYAAKYNASYFEKGAVPEGLLSLGETAAPEDVDAFRKYWAAEVQGRPWALPVVGGADDPKFVDWRKSNRDMQFAEYQAWLLQKIAAVFQANPKDLGQISDVNRSTAESADSAEDEAGLEPILSAIARWINLEIIGQHGQGLGDFLEFAWDEQGESIEEINAKFQPAVEAGAAMRAEWRDALGLEQPREGTPGAEGLEMFLTGGQLQPLPSKQDTEHLGAAADAQKEAEQQKAEADQQDQQRAHEADQTDREAAGTPTKLPWKPADPDHPDVQDAMGAHDEEQGIGPRVSKRSDESGPTWIAKHGFFSNGTHRCATPGCGHGFVRSGPAWHSASAAESKAPRALGACPGCHTPLRGKTAPVHLSSVDKTAPDGHDRNPAMTARTDGLEAVFHSECDRLIAGLAAILAGEKPA